MQSERPAKTRSFRTQHRDRQHESAHAEVADLAPQKIIEHPLISKNPGELIETNEALAEFLSHLRAEKSFAYDSEFIGELSYYPKLCVIQAATTQRIGLIDPMADLDLRPFWELLADESIEKIVHAGEQDIEPVHRLISRRAANVFDTQIASGFVALAYPVGLSKLVNELLGVKLGKGLTFTHWDKRPLSGLQLKYAADDVRYLPAIRAELGRRLEKLGHVAWAKEECDALCDPMRYGFHAENYFLRMRGAGSLQPHGLAVLRELTIWRDAAAKQHDLPARSLVKDEVLLDMSRQPVKSVDKLQRVRGLPRPVETEHGAALVEATLRGLALPADRRPMVKNIEPTPSERFAAESLYAAAAVLCAGRSVDPALVASRQEIAELYRALLEKSALPDAAVLKGWRKEVCGGPLMELFAGKHQLKMKWVEGQLKSV